MAILFALLNLIKNRNNGESTVISPDMPGRTLNAGWAAF